MMGEMGSKCIYGKTAVKSAIVWVLHRVLAGCIDGKFFPELHDVRRLISPLPFSILSRLGAGPSAITKLANSRTHCDH
jgi:hypothetical protein